MSRFRKSAKVCSLVIIVLLVVAALGPAKWAPRTELGWRFDHFIGYLGITLFFCFAWPRPLVVGAIIMAVATLLEGLQALHRIDRLTSRPRSGAQPGRWRLLSLPNCPCGCGDGGSRLLLNDLRIPLARLLCRARPQRPGAPGGTRRKSRNKR